MIEVYLLRHGEKDDADFLSERGKQVAEAMHLTLPDFVRVISSGVDRAILTAKLLTGEHPQIDPRAAYATAPADISNEINAIAKKRGISFLDAARLYDDSAVLKGIDDQARALNVMIDELLQALPEGEKALIVSHDLTIAPAIGFRGMPAESIDPLSGYIISIDDGAISVRRYLPPLH